MVMKGAHRLPMILDPSLHPVMRDLLLSLAASQRQAGHQSGRNSPISTESHEQPTFGAGIPAAILEALQGRQTAGADRRLLANLLIHVLIQSLHLVARFGMRCG